MSQIELTFKDRDIEEILDIYFYRPLGYIIALMARKVNITPNAISVFSIIFGIIAGFLFYYNNFFLNIIGIVSLVFAEILDSADGQLARITQKYSKIGRILDGFAGNLIFLNIYINLCIRLYNEHSQIWIFGLVILSGICHSIQNAMADYYRNAYLKFYGYKNKGEMDKSEILILKYNEISWKKSFLEKFFLRIYINYTLEQELFSKSFKELLMIYENNLNNSSPEWLKKEYKKVNKPLIKYYNILTTNTRMIILFISVLVGNPLYYLLFEVSILNLLLLYVLIKQRDNNNYLKKIILSKAGVLDA